MNYKDKLYKYRVVNKLKQHDLAIKLGISQPLYSLIETGRKQPSDYLILKINEIIKCKELSKCNI
jgi:transcriptional regulator with XRE-family HTH domain